MKKLIIFLIVLLLPINCYALERKTVKLDSCIDGDTISVIMSKRKVKVRMLAIDTPELEHNNKKEEPYGLEAKNFTCNRLKKAKKIELEFDKKSSKKDKYDRYLAWVFYDGKLLQKEIVKNGYADVTYLYDNYKYIDQLKEANTYAKLNKKGIYSDIDTSKYTKERTIEKIIYEFYKKLKASVNDFMEEILKKIDEKSI